MPLKFHRPSKREFWRGILGLAVLGVLALQFQTVRTLRAENARLRSQSRRLQSLEAESVELHRLRTQLAEPERVRRDILELHRLRKEVQDLRAGRTNPAVLVPLDPDGVANTDTNAVEVAEAPVEENPALEPPAVRPMVQVAKGDWQYRGFDTPTATAETILWAGRENRVDVFLDSFIPEIRAEFEQAMNESGVSPALDAQDGPIAEASALKVISVLTKGSSEVEMTYVVEGWHDGKPFRQPLRQTTNGWKFSGDPEDVETE